MYKRFLWGFIDPLSLIGIGVLIISLITGTIVVSRNGFNLDIRKKAAGNECGGGNYCDYWQGICYKIGGSALTAPKCTKTPDGNPPSVNSTSKSKTNNAPVNPETKTINSSSSSPSYCNVKFNKNLGCATNGCKSDEQAQEWTKVDCTNTVRCISDSSCTGFVPQCQSGNKKCNGNDSQECSTNGTWGISTSCGSYGCNSGSGECNQPIQTENKVVVPVTPNTDTNCGSGHQDCSSHTPAGRCLNYNCVYPNTETETTNTVTKETETTVGNTDTNCGSGHQDCTSHTLAGRCLNYNCVYPNAEVTTNCDSSHPAAKCAPSTDTCFTQYGQGNCKTGEKCGVGCTTPSTLNECDIAGGCGFGGCADNQTCTRISGILKCVLDASCTTEALEWHYQCSDSGGYLYYINNHSDIDWTKTKECLCKNDACVADVNECLTAGGCGSGGCSNGETCTRISGVLKCVSNPSCTVAEPGWHYECSNGGTYALYVNDKDLGVDWTKSIACNTGCENGICIGGEYKGCSEGWISPDGFEKCTNGDLKCVPGKTRRLTLPGQSNMSGTVEGCDANGKKFSTSDTPFINTLSCDGNNLVSKSNGSKTIVTTCSDSEVCLNRNDYPFVNYPGCYYKAFISANTCKEGETKDAQNVGDCKYVCKRGAWVYDQPLDCIRDPKELIPRECSADGRFILDNGKITGFCLNKCSYGECIHNPNASCKNGDSYISNSPACLVTCVGGKYQETNTCINKLDFKGTWSNTDILMLLKTINRFPEQDLNTIDKVTFERLPQPYAECFENCVYLAAGNYVNSNGGTWFGIPGTIRISDTAANEFAIQHEIIHALDDEDPQIIKKFEEVTGCQENPSNPNGGYIYSKETPYRDYGSYNCAEGLAVSCGEEYMDPQLSCTMKTNRPNTYGLCKDTVFNGKEYCQKSESESYIFNKLFNLTAGLSNVLYAAEIFPTTVPNSIESKLNSIVLGTTKFKEVEGALGTPKETIQQEDTTIYTYTSSDISRPHIIYVKNGIVTFLQIVLGENYKLSSADVTTQYGVPEDKSYSTHSHNALVYSYPSKGISFHIDGNSGQVFMIQKYVPLTIEVFKETIGKDFKDQPLGDSFQEIALIKNQLAEEPVVKKDLFTILKDNLPIVLIIDFIVVLVIIFRNKIANIFKSIFHKNPENTDFQ